MVRIGYGDIVHIPGVPTGRTVRERERQRRDDAPRPSIPCESLVESFKFVINVRKESRSHNFISNHLHFRRAIES